MNLVQMNILEAYAILQYSMMVVAFEIESNVSTGKFLIIQFLESRSVLGAKFSSVYNTSTGESKYIKIVKNYYQSNFRNFPKLCITILTLSPFLARSCFQSQ